MFRSSFGQGSDLKTFLTVTDYPVYPKLTEMPKVLTDARSIRIKGRSFLAVVLSPELPFDDWLVQLDDLARRSAGFFLERPVVLDVTDLEIDRKQLKALIDELVKRNVRVMGLEGARPSWLGPGMPPAMRGGKPASDFEIAETTPVADTAAAQAIAEPPKPQIEVAELAPVRMEAPSERSQPQSMVIREPVRSGQSVIFPEGDVTVIGSVASGAEIIAGGSVHIYGTLRGRALAGTLGNASARIFCRRLEAELLAIDGIYTTADEMSPDLLGQAVHLWLDGDAIRAQKLT
jgi:septum site-determining protein MinC